MSPYSLENLLAIVGAGAGAGIGGVAYNQLSKRITVLKRRITQLQRNVNTLQSRCTTNTRRSGGMIQQGMIQQQICDDDDDCGYAAIRRFLPSAKSGSSRGANADADNTKYNGIVSGLAGGVVGVGLTSMAYVNLKKRIHTLEHHVKQIQNKIQYITQHKKGGMRDSDEIPPIPLISAGKSREYTTGTGIATGTEQKKNGNHSTIFANTATAISGVAGTMAYYTLNNKITALERTVTALEHRVKQLQANRKKPSVSSKRKHKRKDGSGHRTTRRNPS